MSGMPMLELAGIILIIWTILFLYYAIMDNENRIDKLRERIRKLEDKK